MSWKESNVIDERIKFVAKLMEGEKMAKTQFRNARFFIKVVNAALSLGSWCKLTERIMTGLKNEPLNFVHAIR
jgi:hypothetical protein